MTLDETRDLVEKQNGTLSVEQIEELLSSLESDTEVPEPTWGNCKRGCVPSYLNSEGYCSPQCALGNKRGA